VREYRYISIGKKNVFATGKNRVTCPANVKAEFIWLLPDVANDNQPFGGSDGGPLLLSASADGVAMRP
jgi:hypothetical protein